MHCRSTPPTTIAGSSALVDAPMLREGGYLTLPTRPGIGLEVNEAALSAYPPVPYTRPALIGRDGGLREY